MSNESTGLQTHVARLLRLFDAVSDYVILNLSGNGIQTLRAKSSVEHWFKNGPAGAHEASCYAHIILQPRHCFTEHCQFPHLHENSEMA